MNSGNPALRIIIHQFKYCASIGIGWVCDTRKRWLESGPTWFGSKPYWGAWLHLKAGPDILFHFVQY
jgi:hypothetical protein